MRKYQAELALFTVIIMLFVCMPITAQAAKTYTGTINKDNIFFRSRATTNSGWILRFKKGDKIVISGVSGDFYKASFKNKSGYVMKKFVSLSSAASAALNSSKTAAATTAPKTSAPTKAQAAAASSTVKSSSSSGTIIKDNIFFRTRPTTSSGWSRRFKKGDKVEIIGESGDFYKVTYLNKTGYVMKKFVSLPSTAAASLSSTASSASSGKLKTEKLVWFNTGKNIFVSGAVFQIKDVATGKVWNCKRLYAGNHLDAEPLTASDTKIMKAAYGGTINYVRRPVLVKYDGHVYAGSMYGEPHGDYSITNNNFNGQFCIHFTGSKTSNSSKVDSTHQAAVKNALNASW